jgi:hypothetical protein
MRKQRFRFECPFSLWKRCAVELDEQKEEAQKRYIKAVYIDDAQAIEMTVMLPCESPQQKSKMLEDKRVLRDVRLAQFHPHLIMLSQLLGLKCATVKEAPAKSAQMILHVFRHLLVLDKERSQLSRTLERCQTATFKESVGSEGYRRGDQRCIKLKSEMDVCGEKILAYFNP